MTKTKEQSNTHIIDATGQSLGRVASEVAHFLIGKHDTKFAKHIVSGVIVHVVNASKLQITQKKKENKKYTRYTGYPGGLRKEELGSLLNRRGYGEALRKAVYGMLPSNKLRPEMLKRLIIEE